MQHFLPAASLTQTYRHPRVRRSVFAGVSQFRRLRVEPSQNARGVLPGPFSLPRSRADLLQEQDFVDIIPSRSGGMFSDFPGISALPRQLEVSTAKPFSETRLQA